MEDFQQRVLDEKTELDGKREKLDVFSKTVEFSNLLDVDKGLLQAQYYLMGSYSDLLQERIDRFS